MQKISVCFIGFILYTLVSSCNPTQEQNQIISQHGGQKAKLEVFYFHPTMRCAACNAVENNTIKVLQESFHSQVENGTIRFVSYNMLLTSNLLNSKLCGGVMKYLINFFFQPLIKIPLKI